MDKKDKKLLYYLDKDIRTPYSKLAKTCKLSQETVRYRVENLVKKGIIKKFVPIINSNKFGITFYQLLLKLQNINGEIKNKIIKSLINEERISWLANIEGNYDLAIIISAKTSLELNEIIEKIHLLLKKHIIKKALSIHLLGEFFPRDYLIEKKRELKGIRKYSSSQETIKLSKINLKICKELAKNGRISFVELSNKIGLSADAITNRFRQLKNQDIITGSTIITDQNKLNQYHYKILLYLNDLSKDKINSLLTNIKTNNRVISLVQTLAEWDYEIDLEVETPNELRMFIMNLTLKFSNIIRNYESIRILDMPKYNFFP